MIPLINNSEDAIKYIGQKIKFICQKCGREVERKVRKDRERTYTIFLCHNCSREKTCLEKYGAKSNLVVQSNPKKYWEDHHDEILEKRRKTSIEKYGVESPNQSKEVQRKMIEAKLKNCSYIKQRENDRKTKLERYGNENYNNSVQITKSTIERREKFEKEYDCVSVVSLRKKYGQGFLSLKLPQIYDCCGRTAFIKNEDIPKILNYISNKHKRSSSKGEKEVYKFIKQIYFGTIENNKRKIIQGYELDIYLPEINIAVEYNGSYFHSTNFKDKYYHQNKTLACYKIGIRLAHILDVDWEQNKNMVKDKLKRLILNKESFNDGFFPSFENNIKLSEPRKHIIGKLEYYDTGVIM